MSGVSRIARRSSPVYRVAALTLIIALVTASGAAAARQPSRTGVSEHPALRKERIARELEERRERQLRAGLTEAAAETAKELAEMTRAQIEKCTEWWTVRDAAERGRPTKAQMKVLTDKKTAPQMAVECYWRPGVAPDGDDRVVEPVTLRDITAMRLAIELNGQTRALLFVEPVLTITIDPDLVSPMMGYMSVATAFPEFARLMVEANRLSAGGADLRETDQVLQQMLALAQRPVPPKPDAVLFVMGMRRQFAEFRGDMPAALNHAREEVAFVETNFGGSSIQLCPPLWQLASLLMSSGQPERAVESVNRCLGLAAPRGAGSLTYASALNNLGVICDRSGATDCAVDAYQKSLAGYERNAAALRDRFTTVQDPVLPVRANLGMAFWRSGDVPQAYRHLQLARERMLTEGNTYISERGVIESMAKLSAELDVFLTVERELQTGGSALALPMLLERKGFALGTRAAAMQALAGDSAQLREYRRLLAYRSMLARATPLASDEREKQRTVAIEVDLQIQTLEVNAKQQASMAALIAPKDPRAIEYAKAFAKALGKLTEERAKRPPKNDRRTEPEVRWDVQRQAQAEIAPQFKDYLEAQQRAARGNRENLVQSIQAALPETAALVEMVRFRPFNAAADAPGERWAAPRYGAYVVRRTGTPAFVDWGDAAAIDEPIVEFRRALSQPRGTLAHDLGRRLDAALMQPLRAALGTATQIYLSPDGALNLVPFGALVDEQERYRVETLTFTYVSSGRDLMRAPAATPPVRGPGPAVVVADPAFDTGAPAATAATTRSVLGTHFDPLPGTAAEAQAIKRLLADATIFTGDQATETALKGVAAPRVLHVATHGFFLEDQDLSAALQPGTAAAAEDPMLRSGLVFAGANTGRSGTDDGVLTALEAAALDLAGTELVVLSACETGVGDVRTGEGVFGLRRAFMVAGAETLVMSLWQVDDDATTRLMEEFYGRLAKGEGRAEALRQASLALLREPARRHPFYWASFIAAGDGGRMR